LNSVEDLPLVGLLFKDVHEATVLSHLVKNLFRSAESFLLFIGLLQWLFGLRVASSLSKDFVFLDKKLSLPEISKSKV
jgi:hypothetical protein